MEYDQVLDQQFKDLEINLVRHDTGSAPGCLPCYIEVRLGKRPKDMGQTARDLSNYIYRRFGLRYQSVPEYRGKGKSMTIRWFMSKDNAALIVPNIAKALGCIEAVALLRLNSLIIQNPARGVHAPEASYNDQYR